MIDTDGAPREADSGARWWVALFAVGAALIPSALALSVWLSTGQPQPRPTVLVDAPSERIVALHEAIGAEVGSSRVNAVIMQIYLQSQLDPDECKADFAATASQPSSERLPFYFC